MVRRIVPLIAILILAVIVLSCGKKGVPTKVIADVTTSIQITAGNNQVTTPGDRLIDSMAVRVTASDGTPLANIPVSFTQTSQKDQGYFTYPNPKTNALGYARNYYYPDTTAGADTFVVVASGIDDSEVTFYCTVVPGPFVKLLKPGSPGQNDNQSGTAGDTLANPCIVQAVDRYNNGISNIRVRFIEKTRGVLLTDSSAALPYLLDTAFTRTDDNGLATVQWIVPANPALTSFPAAAAMWAQRMVADTAKDTVIFAAFVTDPGTLKYYYTIRNLFSQYCFACHSSPPVSNDYAMDFYYEISGNGNMTPGDPNSPILAYAQANSPHIFALVDINQVESDLIARWVIRNNASPGQSGLPNYTQNFKPIFDTYCISCHGVDSVAANYNMKTHLGIRGGGADAVPNAIPGADTSLVAQRIGPGGNMREYLLSPDSVALADSIIHWIVIDSLRQY